MFWNGTLIDRPFDVRGNFSDFADIDRLYTMGDSLEEGFGRLKAQCESKESGRYMEYIGTVATVRDMVALADSLEPDTKEINYYGYS